ncbi:SubName: Full=Uncharacterized protein {ECO:0000313/EMBL:CCA72540.1} [Serendipita indica DSM 11827]|nr:SubName: Full=Uncharacterized protein {ECO:0000313/EMBL:CCA72540.1} [Serendipita indica DSM 11827]
MDDVHLPSRFVSQKEIDETNAKKDELWKAAYARMGQEPPPQAPAEAYDGRSLAEKLAANRAAKDEEYANAHKLSAQFRPLNPDEVGFLDSIALKRFEEEQSVKRDEAAELKNFRACGFMTLRITFFYSFASLDDMGLIIMGFSAVQARESSLQNPPIVPSTSKETKDAKPSKSAPANPSKARVVKPGLKGVVVSRKRAKTADTANSKENSKDKEDANQEGGSSPQKETAEEEQGGDRKRRKVDTDI